MATFQTDLQSLDIPCGSGAIHITGYVYQTEDPNKCALLRRNLGVHLWELKVRAGETVVAQVPKVKTQRGARLSSVQEPKEEQK